MFGVQVPCTALMPRIPSVPPMLSHVKTAESDSHVTTAESDVRLGRRDVRVRLGRLDVREHRRHAGDPRHERCAWYLYTKHPHPLPTLTRQHLQAP